jgi:hypothetical protein
MFHAIGTEYECGGQASTVAEATRCDHRNVDLPGSDGIRIGPGMSSSPWVTGTFEAVDADAVDTQVLCFDGMSHAGALV